MIKDELIQELDKPKVIITLEEYYDLTQHREEIKNGHKAIDLLRGICTMLEDRYLMCLTLEDRNELIRKITEVTG